MAARTTPPSGSTNTLALAVIASSTAPLLLLDGDFKVIAASDSFRTAFQVDPLSHTQPTLFALGRGQWDIPQLRSLLKATADGVAEINAYEMDLAREGAGPRRLVLSARRLEYDEPDEVRILLSVSDVTDARLAEKLKDDLLREKAILLQELQHRVANSLQIIASVLLQSARRASSDETRSHLYDAHSRVMSVASVQQQLAASRLGDVELRRYFTDLCASIGASMIRDHNQITLTVHVDDSVTTADVSVSLGLIVTELVINALKHAFPGRRKGKISVDYRSTGPDWTLSVEDDGVGMPLDAASSKAGLGTSIVEALARQLHADVVSGSNDPGTTVSLVHVRAAVVEGGASKAG